jgi:hypothetical protein
MHLSFNILVALTCANVVGMLPHYVIHKALYDARCQDVLTIINKLKKNSALMENVIESAKMVVAHDTTPSGI